MGMSSEVPWKGRQVASVWYYREGGKQLKNDTSVILQSYIRMG